MCRAPSSRKADSGSITSTMPSLVCSKISSFVTDGTPFLIHKRCVVAIAIRLDLREHTRKLLFGNTGRHGECRLDHFVARRSRPVELAELRPKVLVEIFVAHYGPPFDTSIKPRNPPTHIPYPSPTSPFIPPRTSSAYPHR